MLKILDLKTNHRSEPLGIDGVPYFGWKLCSSEKNVTQQAYQLTVEDVQTKEVVWDSGAVSSSQSSFADYAGAPLHSCTEYRWTVRVWDNHGECAAASADFETAFLCTEDWKARWAESTLERVPDPDYPIGASCAPVLFRKSFRLPQQPVRARLYSTAYGVYQIKINDRRPDDREFAPEFTSYAHRLYYQTYDVTALLRSGDNMMEMYVGDGWYFSAFASPVAKHPHAAPGVLFQLELWYEDGTREHIISDGTESCELSYILCSDLFQGEKQDFTQRQQIPQPVALRDYPMNILRAQPMDPIRPVAELPARRVFRSPKGEWIVDFGQVLAGRARVLLNTPQGTTVTLEYFEELDCDGNYLNTMFAPQRDVVVTGDLPFVHEALFTFHGFRYLRVTGLDIVRKEDFTAVLLTTEKANIGSFHCSDARLNRLYQNVRWSQAGNMMSIPTDCPTREKAGWTGDMLIYAPTALLNEDVTPFFTSWLAALRDEQAEGGAIMVTAPYAKMYHSVILDACKVFGDTKPTGVAGWSDAIVWVPYAMYQSTGNIPVLRENYDAMCRWGDYILRRSKEKRGSMNIPYEYDQYLWNTGFHFGEWLVPSRPDNTGRQYGICEESAFYAAPFFGYQTIRYLADIAKVLGDKDKAACYREESEKMRRAIQNGILRADLLPRHLMGGYVLAFAFDLVPEELKEEYRQRLVTLIQQHGNCLDTGFLATPFLLDVLMDLGENALAETVLWQSRRPGWLYETDHGATTIWEAWDADDAKKGGRFVSFNHYAFGCVDDFIARRIAGLQPEAPGYTKVRIAPRLLGGLTSLDRTFCSENGEIRISVNEDELSVTIPCGVTAAIEWGGVVTQTGSGTYTFDRLGRKG